MRLQGTEEPESRESVKKALASAVVDYLKTYPRAMDTVSGIAEWWLPGHGARVDSELLRQALEELTRQGVLEQIDAGEYKHYRLKRMRLGRWKLRLHLR
jgi:hypothetical protein